MLKSYDRIGATLRSADAPVKMWGFGKIQKAEKDENKTRKFEEENSVHQSVNVEQRSAGSTRLARTGEGKAARGGESSSLRTWKEEHPAQWE